MSWTIWVCAGAIFAAFGVGAGAFGAHALKARLTPEYLAVFEVGVKYQMYHALALIALGLVATRIESTAIKVSGFAFIGGTLLFSGSLYALVLSGEKSLGMVTPVGGVALIVGWLALAIAMIH